MITLHHLEHSRSLRILWALEELGLEYEVKFYRRLPTYAAASCTPLTRPTTIRV